METRGYDPGGRLVATADVMGRKTSTVYWMDGKPKQQIADDAKLNGLTTARDVVVRDEEYDAAGNLIAQTNGGIATTLFEYDPVGRVVTQVVDPDGLERVTQLNYDENGNTVKSTQTAAGTSRSETTSFAYNKLNQPTKQTVENGAQDLTSTIGYDDRGLAVTVTDPRGNVDGAQADDYTTTMRYDVLDRLVETTAPEVKVDKNGTATAAHPTTRVGYDMVGNTTHQTDAEGRTLVSTFDKAGRLTSSSSPAYTPPGGNAITPAIRFGYDAAGQRKTSTDPRGYVTSYDYDQLGRQVRVTDPAAEGQQAGTWVTDYDLAGEVLATTDPTGARTQATYDDLGRQVTSTQVERKPSTANYTTSMTYDDAGRLTKQTAPGSKVTSYTVNPAGEVTAVTDPLTNTTTKDYDLAGRLIKTTDPNGNATINDYDLAGRKIATKDLDGTKDPGTAGAVLRTTGFGYDAAGNQTSATTAEGHVTRQTVDALNRITARIEPVSASESITTSFGYDATGARTRIIDGRGNATWTSYNTLGLAETITEPATSQHPDAADRTWTHIYDADGNQVATLEPGGVRIDRTFDPLGQVTKETGSGAGAATAERNFGYDLVGRRTSAGDLNVSFNDRGLPLAISRSGVQETSYAYDALGNPTQRIDATGTATFTWEGTNRLKTATDPLTNRTLTYGYDKASRLKTITATGQVSTQSIDYDAMDRVTGQTLKNGSGTQLAKITYGWDLDDNLTSKTTAGTAGAGTNTYAYDHAGRLTSWTAPGGAVTEYGWDASGNRTKAGAKTFTYDERNRLTSGDGADYTYTPRGTLASQTKDGTTTSYTFDAFDRLIADGDSLYSYDALDRLTSRIRGTSKHTFAYSGLGNDLAAITESGTTVGQYARDPRGSLLGLKEGASAAVGAFTDLHDDLMATFASTLQTSTAYDPFGTVIAQTGAKNQLGYQSEYTDPDSGKVNMHARWYQPGTGTFTSRDTVTLNPAPSVQANRYTYANATPLTATDPTGHMIVMVPNGNNEYIVDSGPSLAETLGVVDSQWYFENYVLPSLPSFSDEEAKRIGVMTNGMTAPKDYWKMTASKREGFAKFASWMNWVNPAITEQELLGVQSPASGGSVGKPPTTWSYYDGYKRIVRYWRDIDSAASNHGINKYVLAAVLMYESKWWADQWGIAGDAVSIQWDKLPWKKGQGENASVGLAQLEVYKGRMMLAKHYGAKFNDKNKYSTEWVAGKLNNPQIAIHLAAAWMRHLKENITIDGRHLTDMEAAVAYCGCSGVVVYPDKKEGEQIRPEKFVAWVKSGYTSKGLQGVSEENHDTAIRRRTLLEQYAGAPAHELWECGRVACWTYQ